MGFYGRAQDCAGMKIKSGTGYELQSYNARDKPNGRIVYRFKDVRKEGGATVVDVEMQSIDEKGKAASPTVLKYTCTGNELIIDMSGMAQMTNGTMRDGEMRMKINELPYPAKLSAGQKLKDGQMSADFYSNGSKMMEMNLTMANRQVEGPENLTTPAGTFTAYKVSGDMNVDNRTMGIPIRVNFRTVSYRTNDLLFDVKTETYNKSGKLMGYTILSKVL